ncbi:hypothetical protein CDL12_29475 [Handroanthus impetiginosus]|uniref:Uncharacterized protein n=1 Tax=Handroanthus impetiginosus TaxID=429701 RepID=A0A2G9FYS4_9LAMI|nr:hypothetical protein CDL12_29475 [Handroanthus impetiginosus]
MGGYSYSALLVGYIMLKVEVNSKNWSDMIKSLKGAFRESNSGPLAPKARIIPLDQMPNSFKILVEMKNGYQLWNSFMVDPVTSPQ